MLKNIAKFSIWVNHSLKIHDKEISITYLSSAYPVDLKLSGCIEEKVKWQTNV